MSIATTDGQSSPNALGDGHPEWCDAEFCDDGAEVHIGRLMRDVRGVSETGEAVDDGFVDVIQPYRGGAPLVILGTDHIYSLTADEVRRFARGLLRAAMLAEGSEGARGDDA